MKEQVDYSTRIQFLMTELQSKTLTQAERDRNITQLDYIGVGYGYNLKSHFPKTMKQAEKDTKTPELRRLEKIIRSMD